MEFNADIRNRIGYNKWQFESAVEAKEKYISETIKLAEDIIEALNFNKVLVDKYDNEGLLYIRKGTTIERPYEVIFRMTNKAYGLETPKDIKDLASLLVLHFTIKD